MSKSLREIEELMKGYTVKFESLYRGNKSCKGTGFILTKDGLIATCSHVIQGEAAQKSNKRPPKSVRLVFEATKEVGWATIVGDYWRPIADGDLAILKLKKPLPNGIQVAPLSRVSASIGNEFEVFGYPTKKDVPSPPGLFGSGSRIHTRIENSQFKAVAIHQLDISKRSVARGHSGSAVFDLETESVVGMITAIDPGDQGGRLGETAYAVEIDEFVKICPELEKVLVLASLPQTLEKESSTAKVISQEILPELLRVTWVRNRRPIEFDRLKDKIESAVSQVTMGTKVVILGEAGIGKRTLLFLICQRLLELDVKLFTGEPPSSNIGDFVFVSDNLSRNPNLIAQLSLTNSGVLATSRKHEWPNNPLWYPINLTKDDYTKADLTKILVSAASERVRLTPEGIDLAVEKSGGSPGYLIALVDYMKRSNQTLDKNTASKVPSSIYEIEAEQLCYIANTQSLSVSVLYAIAKTKKTRLHRDQISSLIARLKQLRGQITDNTDEKLDAWTEIAFFARDLYTIENDTWRELLLLDWKGLKIGASEPEPLIDIRSRPIEIMLEEIFEDSLSHLADWNSESGYRLAEVVVENEPKLALKLIELVTATEARIHPKLKPQLMDLAAIKNPDETSRWLQGLTMERLGEAQFESDEAPNYMILWGEMRLKKVDATWPKLMGRSNSELSCVSETMEKLGSAYHWKGLQDEAIKVLSKALGIYRHIVKCDEQFMAGLVKTLTVLGASYRDKGSFGESIVCLKEALDVSRKQHAKNEPYNADLADALSEFGSVYWWDGQSDQAIKCLNEALKINRQMVETYENLKPNMAITLTRLGTTYRERGNLAKAIECLKEASDLYDELSANNDRYRHHHAQALYNLGPAYWLKGRFDDAVKVCEYALKINQAYAIKDVRGTRELARTLNNLGVAYRWRNRTDDAIVTLEKAESCSRELTDRDGKFTSDLAAYVFVTTLFHLSAVYQRKGKLDKAINRLKEALKYSAIAKKGGHFALRFIGIRIMLALFFIIRGQAGDMQKARELCTETQKLLEKQNQLRNSNLIEYSTIIHSQEDLQALLLAS